MGISIRTLKRFQIIFILIISSCGRPLPEGNSIETVSPDPLITVVPITPGTVPTETAVSPSQDELEINYSVTVLECYCDSRVKRVMLTIEPDGGIGPYSLSVEPYVDTRTPFNDIQNFEANPGSVLTIHVYSADSKSGTVVIQIPSDCGIGNTCGNKGNQTNTVVPPPPPDDPPPPSVDPSPPPIDTPPVEVCIPPNLHSQKCKND
jgi:hypothetical protein